MTCEFSKQHYTDCINLAKDKGYSIIPVKDYDKQDKVIVLRHDVDYSLDYAHKLAEHENKLDIKSTYYIYLHSETYNVLEPRSLEILEKIMKLGHEIGLHYDSRYYLAGEQALFNMKTYTQHHPSENKPMKLPFLTDPNDFNLKYISDSGRNWREGCMCQWIGKQNLHILTHPLWWVNGGVRDKVMHDVVQLAKDNLDTGRDNYLKVLRKYCEDLGIVY